MRHKFTAEETVKGFKRAQQVRREKIKIEKKALKERSKEWFWDQVGKLSEPDKMVYLAVFTWAALVAYDSHTDKYNEKGVMIVKGLPPADLAWEAFRQGLEGIIALKLCTTSSPGLSASTSQAYGIALLTGIALQTPLSAFEKFIAGSKDPTKTFGITNPDFITNFNKWFASVFPWAT